MVGAQAGVSQSLQSAQQGPQHGTEPEPEAPPAPKPPTHQVLQHPDTPTQMSSCASAPAGAYFESSFDPNATLDQLLNILTYIRGWHAINTHKYNDPILKAYNLNSSLVRK